MDIKIGFVYLLLVIMSIYIYRHFARWWEKRKLRDDHWMEKYFDAKIRWNLSILIVIVILLTIVFIINYLSGDL